MVRAKFCELVSDDLKGQYSTSICFLTGLLSKIDAILDEEIETVLDKLPLSQEIKEPLLTNKGVMAALIKLVELIEQAEWSKTGQLMEKLQLDKETVLKHYNEAVSWADETLLASN